MLYNCTNVGSARRMLREYYYEIDRLLKKATVLITSRY